MKRFLRSIFIVQDSKARLARSLVFGSLLALAIGFSTSDVSYTNSAGSVYNHNTPFNSYLKKTKYHSTVILMGFIFGTALGYSILREECKATHKDNY